VALSQALIFKHFSSASMGVVRTRYSTCNRRAASSGRLALLLNYKRRPYLFPKGVIAMAVQTTRDGTSVTDDGDVAIDNDPV
jgi:hypothetical protein